MNDSSVRKRFIVLEGIDFAGKTTIADNLASKINGEFIKSPTKPFAAIKQDVLENSTPVASFCFFLASNIHTSEIVKEILPKKDVVCDRYIWSTIAYHSAIANIDADKLVFWVQPFSHFLAKPDYAVFLSVDRETQMMRSKKRIVDDKLQQRLLLSDTFQQRLKKAYYEIRDFLGISWIEIDTSDISISEITRKILEEITK